MVSVCYEWVSLQCCRLVLPGPASGSAKKHLPFPHKSAPVYCSISTGDARRLEAQAANTSRRNWLKTETAMFRNSSSTSWFSRNVFVFGLSFHVISSGALAVGKHEDNCRFPWMMMPHDECRLVVNLFMIMSGKQTLKVFTANKLRLCECVLTCLFVLLFNVIGWF